MFSFARSCICQSSICFYQKFNLLMQLTCMQTEAWMSKKCICTFNSFSEIQCSFTETWIQMFSFATGCQNCTSFGKSNIYLTFAVDICKQKPGWQKCICTFPLFFKWKQQIQGQNYICSIRVSNVFHPRSISVDARECNETKYVKVMEPTKHS